MSQRLGIAAALLGDPQLLILDEPVNGLDPDGILEVRSLLRTLTGGGMTVLVSSHLLGELEQVCDHLIVLDHGREVFQGPTAHLLQGGDELLVAPEHARDVAVLVDVLRRSGLDPVAVDGRVRLPASIDPAEANRIAAKGGITLRELQLSRASLEARYGALMASGQPR